MSFFIVGCEAHGPCPSRGQLTVFAAIDFTTFFKTGKAYTFRGEVTPHVPSQENPAIPLFQPPPNLEEERMVYTQFLGYLDAHKDSAPEKLGNPVFWSDNPAFDWQWINDGFHRTIGRNPFGFSARRIGDFYAGLSKNLYRTQDWKKLRRTTHDHDPVNDVIGNAEALASFMATHGVRL